MADNRVTLRGEGLSGARVNLLGANERVAFGTFAAYDGSFRLPVFAGALYWLHLVEYVPVFLWIIGYWWFVRAGKQALTPDTIVNAAS